MQFSNLSNIGLELIFTGFYVIILLLTVIILTLRYIIVALGVVFVPIGIFLYFIPPLSSYGKLILNFLGICVFLVFIDALILLVSSQLLTISIFQNFKILVMISAFLLIDITMFYLMFFSAIKSAFKTAESTAGTIGAVAKYFV